MYLPPLPGSADFTLMMECTPEGGHCHLGVECKLSRRERAYTDHCVQSSMAGQKSFAWVAEFVDRKHTPTQLTETKGVPAPTVNYLSQAPVVDRQ